jgi:membrane protein DedA with SNARE-associated domain
VIDLASLDLGALVLSWIASYGAPMVGAVLLLGAAGVPLPSTLIVIASGAFVRQNLLDLYSTPVLGFLGTVAGDLVLYGLGRFASGWIEGRFGRAAFWLKARQLFDQRGGLAVFLTRWLLTSVAFPVSLVAGSSRYRFGKYALLVFAGELIWISLYGGLGYAFGSQWELISDFITNFSGFLIGAAILAAGVFLLLRARPKPALAPAVVPEMPEAPLA